MTRWRRVADPSVEIAAFVAAVRRRLRRAQLWRAIGTGGGIALGSFGVLLCAAALVPAATWRPLALLLGGGALGTGGVMALKAAARWRRDESVARHVSERVGDVGDDLWSAVELERELPRLEANPLLSPALVKAHRQRVSERLRAIDPTRVAPLRRARSAWPLLLAA